jgi:hypothetical protein
VENEKKIRHRLSLQTDLFCDNFKVSRHDASMVELPSVSATRISCDAEGTPSFVLEIVRQMLFEMGAVHARPPVLLKEMILVAVHDNMTGCASLPLGDDRNATTDFEGESDDHYAPPALSFTHIEHLAEELRKDHRPRRRTPTTIVIACPVPEANHGPVALHGEPVVVAVTINVTHCYSTGGCTFNPQDICLLSSTGTSNTRPLSSQSVTELLQIFSTSVEMVPPNGSFTFSTGEGHHGDDTLALSEERRVAVELQGTLFTQPVGTRSTAGAGSGGSVPSATTDSALWDIWVVVGIEDGAELCVCTFVQTVALAVLCSPIELGVLQQSAFHLVEKYAACINSASMTESPESDLQVAQFKCSVVRDLALSYLKHKKPTDDVVGGDAVGTNDGRGSAVSTKQKRVRSRKASNKPSGGVAVAAATAVDVDAQGPAAVAAATVVDVDAQGPAAVAAATAVDVDAQGPAAVAVLTTAIAVFDVKTGKQLADMPSIECGLCGKWRVWRGSKRELTTAAKGTWECKNNIHDEGFALCSIPSLFQEEEGGAADNGSRVSPPHKRQKK